LKRIGSFLNKAKSIKASIAVTLVLIVLLSCFSAFAYTLVSSPDNTSDSASANTLSSVGTSGVPAKVAVTCTPPRVLASNDYHYYAIKIELQDLYENPAYAPTSGMGISVSSSDPTVGYASPNYVHLSAGQAFETITFVSTYKPGQTKIEATAVGLVSGSAIMTTVGAKPYKVQVILAPNKVLADNEYYYYPVHVQLQDSAGNPAMASETLLVGLSSSNPNVGTVPTSLAISTGETFGATWFSSTLVPGTTAIKAATSGLVSTNATMTTVAPGASPATKLMVWLAPSKLIADGSVKYYPVVVGLMDSSSRPVEAASTTSVTLASSNSTVGTVPSYLNIGAGDEYGYTYFYSTYVPGKTTIQATVSGLVASSSQMTTVGYTPSRFAVYLAPSKVFAHKQTSLYSVVVQVEDNSGNPARAPAGGLTAIMTSTNPSVGTIPGATLTIGAGQTYAYTHFYATYKPGTTTIRASGTLATGSNVMTTKAPTPAKLGMDLALSKVFAISNKYYYYLVRVILQDAAGNPALAPVGGITVTLTSSLTSIGTVQSPITIPEGDFFATAWFMSKATPGQTTITASASIAGVFKTTSQIVTTISPTANAPTAVKVKLLPKFLSTSQYYYYPLTFYLVDSAGNPAKAPTGGIAIGLSSSDTLVGTVPYGDSIGAGETYSYNWFRSTWSPGVTTISASAVGLTSGSTSVTTGVFTSISKTYTFRNIGYLFYSNTIIVPGDAAHAREVMSAALISYALSKAGTKGPLTKTDGLLTSTEYTSSNLIIIGYNNTKTAAKNTAYGINVTQNTAWFNITATSEGKSINFSKAQYPSKSIAIVYLKNDGSRAVLLSWGYGWLGTYAANLFMSDPNNWSRIDVAGKHLLMLNWTDNNSDGFVQSSEITVASTA